MLIEYDYPLQEISYEIGIYEQFKLMLSGQWPKCTNNISNKVQVLKLSDGKKTTFDQKRNLPHSIM